MSEIKVRLLDNSQCSIQHVFSRKELLTDTPQEYGGRGGSFSSTDLIAAALGSCIATSLAKLAERNNIDLKELEVRVYKSLSLDPRRIASLEVVIDLPSARDEELRTKILKLVNVCPVRRSLHPEVSVKVEICFAADALSTPLPGPETP